MLEESIKELEQEEEERKKEESTAASETTEVQRHWGPICVPGMDSRLFCLVVFSYVLSACHQLVQVGTGAGAQPTPSPCGLS